MTHRHLTRSSTLARNTLLNLIGYAAPLAVALVAIPFLIKGLGTDRFGILTLAWVFIGYLSLLDLGLGRALTKVVAEKLGEGESDDLPETIWTALLVMTLMGSILAVAIQPFIPPTMISLLKIPGPLIPESIAAYRLLAACIPLVIFSVGLRGVLEAYQRFDLTNAVRIPLGVYSFCAPLLVMPFTRSLFWVIASILCGRVFAIALQFYFCSRVVDRFCHGVRINVSLMPALFRFGGWMSVTNMVAPILVRIDGYFIGSLLSIAVVSYYTTPLEVVTKLLLISGALMSVLFPAFSAAFNVDRVHAAKLLKNGIRYIYMIMFPIILLMVIFSREILSLWIDPEFAQQSYKVMQWLSVGVFILSMTQVPYAFIQGAGRPDLPAKVQLLEIPIYLLFLWLMIKSYGIQGAAYVWCSRMLVDMAANYWMMQRIVLRRRVIHQKNVLMMGSALSVLALMSLLNQLLLKIVLSILLLGVFAFVSWRFFLNDDEKAHLLKYLRKNPFH